MSDKSKKQTASTARQRLVLLDTHAILHRAYHALPSFSTSSGVPTGALYGLSSMLIKLLSDLQPDFVVACYDLPEPTHRHQVYDDYKAGRSESDRELVEQIKQSKRIFEALTIPMFEAPGFEADDLLGTLVEQLRSRDDLEIIIASGDMDTMQLVDNDRVKVYTMKRGLRETMMYDEAAVVERFGFTPEYLPDFKGLAGDASDNIPGIKGIGEKTATELIKNFGTLEELYQTLKSNREKLTEAGIKDRIIGLLENEEEEAMFSKMLATIRTDAPIDATLPNKSWRANADTQAVGELFREYEFRGMESRLKEVLGGEGGEVVAEPDKTQEVSEQDRRELPVMLWVYNSDMTSPSLEDVFSVTQADSAKEARRILEGWLEQREVKEVFENIERPIIPVVEAMSERGVLMDRGHLNQLSETYHQELSRIEEKIYQQAGREFNINSPQQLSGVLFDELNLSIKNHKKTSTGKLSTAESELQKMKDQHSIIELILEHRELSKLLGTYIDALPPLLDERDRLHATFLQAGTTTGRMASSDPNLQNIPIRSEHGRAIRDAFVASEGFQLLALDYSQIELRIAAFLSGDEKLLETFRNNQDVHTAVAAEVFEVAPEEVDKEMRRKAKVINFGILYGMGVVALQGNLGSDRAEAQQFYNQYFAKFEGLAGYIERVKEQAHQRGYTETFFGRRRYFSGLDSSLPQVRAGAERMAINAPVQGTAADILKMAMRDINRWLKQAGLEKAAHLLIQVHDELIFEVAEDKLGQVAGEVKSLMEGVLTPEETSGVRLVVEAEAGKNWGNLEHLK